MSNGDFGHAEWRKSSWSGDNGGHCVEVAALPGMVGLRDSKEPAGPVLTATPAEFAAFVRGVARGDFGAPR
jgi:hypothetical protein